jgi:hypothetical protein
MAGEGGDGGRRALGRGRHALWYVLIAALVVVLFGVAGFGPLGFMKRDSAKSSTTTPQSVASKAPKRPVGPATTSTTIFHLERRTYALGDCVAFDQRPGEDTRETQVVNCDRPHLIEMTMGLNLGDRFDHFPTEAEWQTVFDHDCAPGTRRLIRGPLDPLGRYFPTAITPSRESWIHGDRDVWCGVGAVSLTRPPRKSMLMPFTGKVEGTPQARISPIGSCWGDSEYEIPCSQSHRWEVAGYTNLTGKVAQPPALNDDHAWGLLVGDACHVVAVRYLGHEPSNDQRAGWEPIEPGSWAAGRRTVECTVAHYQGTHDVPTVGSMRG